MRAEIRYVFRQRNLVPLLFFFFLLAFFRTSEEHERNFKMTHSDYFSRHILTPWKCGSGKSSIKPGNRPRPRIENWSEKNGQKKEKKEFDGDKNKSRGILAGAKNGESIFSQAFYSRDRNGKTVSSHRPLVAAWPNRTKIQFKATFFNMSTKSNFLNEKKGTDK